jgi:hypothetical protein
MAVERLWCEQMVWHITDERGHTDVMRSANETYKKT